MATLTGMNTPPSPACCVPIPPLSHETFLKADPVVELETKVHPKVRNHGEGPY